jgi:uncharacterized SAM-binding protein YcdF (DUF218 family)
MVPSVLKGALVPGTPVFFLLMATVATLLLFRRKDQGHAGRMLLAALIVFYWIAGTPVTAEIFVRALTPDYRVQTAADAPDATAIVVLSGGMQEYTSRGVTLWQGSREHSLRALEAARVYHILDAPWVIVTGTIPGTAGEGVYMGISLKSLGVPKDRIVTEGAARNTQEHTVYVPPLLAERGVKQFVLVTSRQHMARALAAFRRAGLDPVPSSPEAFGGDAGMLRRFLPSESALEGTTAVIYDVLARVYYYLRGWA